MTVTKLGALVAGAVLVFGACSTGGSSPAAGSAAAGGLNIKIGIELPMSGGEAPNGVPTAHGVELALAQLQVPGFNITINQQDDAVNGKHDANQGAKNLSTLANDPQVVFVIGPYNSSVAQAEIPVSNAAGLMQCSPANTAIALTKGDAAVALRKTNPTKIAYDPGCDHGRQPGRRRRGHRLQHGRREDDLCPGRHTDLWEGSR